MNIGLNDAWKLHKARMMYTKEDLAEVRSQKEDWYDCSLPCDVRMPLIEHGIIKDPVLADYCHDSEWIENYAWWYFKSFDFDQDPKCYEAIELFLEAIDTQSDIFFNGVWLGSHANVHRPFVKDVKEYIRQGENEIAVRVTTGLEMVSDEDLSELNWAVCHERDRGAYDRGDFRRAFVRRPQYSVGWDWGPKVVTCGIVGKAELRCFEKPLSERCQCPSESWVILQSWTSWQILRTWIFLQPGTVTSCVRFLSAGKYVLQKK